MTAHGFDKSANVAYTGSAETNGSGAFCFSPPNHTIYGQNALSHGDTRPVIRFSNGGYHAGGRFAMEQERWKAVGGYEGVYEISDHGRVKSLERVVKNGVKTTRVVQERIRSLGRDRDGYLLVILCLEGVETTVKVHRLVLLAFSGEQPPGCQTSHIDHNRKNNHIGNLAWVTQSENRRHSIDCGRRPGIVKITPEIAKMIREVYALGQHSQSQVGLMFGLSKSTAGNIIRGQIWQRAGGPITRLGKVVPPPDTRWE